MPNFILRVHIAKLKLLVPLHSTNNKLTIKISCLEDTKEIKVQKKLVDSSNFIDLNEDFEFKLNTGANKLSINVYALRTFMDDILLFHNDVSLKKPLSTENIIKLEIKLFNIDKVHVANLYIQLQRQGQVVKSNDFISNFTHQLNLESTKLINKSSNASIEEIKDKEKDQTVVTNQQSNSISNPAGLISGFFQRKAQEAVSEKQLVPSPMEFTQQIFGIPSLKLGFKGVTNNKGAQNNESDDNRSIPNFDLFILNDNFQRFVKALTFPVALYEQLYSIFMIENVKDTLLFLILSTLGILFHELALCLAPIGLVVLIFYIFYTKKEFKKPEVNLIKNMRFIQMSMGQASEITQLSYELIEDFIYWKQPDKTIMLIRELIKLSGFIGLVLMFFQIRFLIVIGLWGTVLSNSKFCVTVIQIIIRKVVVLAVMTYEKIVQSISRRKDFKFDKIDMPFENFYQTLKSYVSFKILKRWEKLKRAQTIEDHLHENIGEEHTETSPFQKELNKSKNIKMRQLSSLEIIKKTPMEETQNKTVEVSQVETDESYFPKQEALEIKDQQRYMSPRTEKQKQKEIKSQLSKSENQNRRKEKKSVELQQYILVDQDEGEYEEDEDTPMPEVLLSENSKSQNKKQNAKRNIYVTFENQRWWLNSWTSALLPGERDNWSDKDGQMFLPKDQFKLPSKDWEWETIWYADKNSQFTDDEGWSYSNDFNGPFRKQQGIFDVVRRRKWIRICCFKGLGILSPSQDSGSKEITEKN